MCGALAQLVFVVQDFADAQLSVHILFFIDMIFFLCYIVLLKATFYVGLMIHTHFCQPRAV
jgi:hypothetical protein